MKTTQDIGPLKALQNIADSIEQISIKSPELPVILKPETKTYSELDRDVKKFSYGLSALGIRKGSKVLVMIPLSYSFFVITIALIRNGAILVMIDPGMGPRAMSKALKGVNPEVFIATLRAHIFRLLFRKTFNSVRWKIALKDYSSLNTISFRTLMAGTFKSTPSVPTEKNDTIGLFFTSGSTGTSKGVLYTKAMVLNQISYLNKYYGYTQGEVDLCTFPLIGLYSVCLGLSTVIAEMNHSKPASADPEKLYNNIRDYRVSHMFCSPMIVRKLSTYLGKHNKIMPDSLQVVISSGAPVYPDLLTSFSDKISANAKLFTPYGATEALPLTNISSAELLHYYAETNNPCEGLLVGNALDGLCLRVITITDNELESICDKDFINNSVGEIIVKGDVVSTEYFNLPDANRLSKIKDKTTGELWHRMGDLGMIDSEDRVFYYGRLAHRVEMPEGSLFTIPVERVFNSHLKVERTALVGVRIEGNTEPVICVELKYKESLESKKIIIKELKEIASGHKPTKNINVFLFKKTFPVDPRHNAKIFREKLAIWAKQKISKY